MKVPDVVGYTLDEATAILTGAGIMIQDTLVTAPPKFRSSTYDKDFRVIRLRVVNESSVELLVCDPDIG
ncbi:MAG: PASTA domain-containing protein [Clostridia bacterium]|nr:PASTA domain-containing protein [Clostridia bacterium]